MEEQQEKEEEDENYSRDTSDETDEEDEDLQPAKQRKPPSLSTNKVLKPREHNRSSVSDALAALHRHHLYLSRKTMYSLGPSTQLL
jgi:hypothetical protein